MASRDGHDHDTKSLHPPGADFVVLHDPDGNEFCVIDHAAG